MSALKERAKRLIDQLPENAIRTLLEELQDELDLERAIAESDPNQAVELCQFLRQLKVKEPPAAGTSQQPTLRRDVAGYGAGALESSVKRAQRRRGRGAIIGWSPWPLHPDGAGGAPGW